MPYKVKINSIPRDKIKKTPPSNERGAEKFLITF